MSVGNDLLLYLLCPSSYFVRLVRHDSLAERSKAPDSSSGGANRVGSNPTAVILFSTFFRIIVILHNKDHQ